MTSTMHFEKSVNSIFSNFEIDERSFYQNEIGKTVRIPFRNIVASAYLFMLLPIIVFLLTWLKLFIGIPASITLLCALYFLLKDNYSEKKYVVFPLKTFVFGFAFLAVFLWVTGNGGFFFQYSDNHHRNAVLFDLVKFDWPMIFPETENAFVYYFLHFLIPALFGKVFNSTLVARIALYLWTLIGLSLVILLLISVLNANNSKKIWFCIFVFFIWSGVSIIGGIISNVFGLTNFSLNEYGWWTNFRIHNQGYGFMIRSNCDQLASVYNQTIAPWLAVLIILNKPKVSIFMFLGLCVFAYSPLPFIGIFVIMVAYFIVQLIAANDKTERIFLLKSIFSLSNILGLVMIFPIFFSFYTCNVAATTGASGGVFGLYIKLENFKYYTLLILLLYYFLQFGVYALCIFKDNRKNFLYWTCVVSMCITPLIQLGTMGDFCWNVSVPFFFVLMILTVKFVFDNTEAVINTKKLTVSKNVIVLSFLFSLSALNPLSQIAFGFKIAYINKTFDLMCRGVVDTFSNKSAYDKVLMLQNYLVPNYENHFFFKHLAKKNKSIYENGKLFRNALYKVSPANLGKFSLCLDGKSAKIVENEVFLEFFPVENTYRIISQQERLALDIPYNTVDEDGFIWSCVIIDDSPAQKFHFEQIGDFYKIRIREYALAYDETGRVYLEKSSDNPSQLWSVTHE